MEDCEGGIFGLKVLFCKVKPQFILLELCLLESVPHRQAVLQLSTEPPFLSLKVALF